MSPHTTLIPRDMSYRPARGTKCAKYRAEWFSALHLHRVGGTTDRMKSHIRAKPLAVAGMLRRLNSCDRAVTSRQYEGRLPALGLRYIAAATKAVVISQDEVRRADGKQVPR